MPAPELDLHLSISESEADTENLERLTLNWMRDLREMGAESVERSAGGEFPEGAKGDPSTMGVILLAVVPALLQPLIEFSYEWVTKKERRTLKIKRADGKEIELTSDKTLSMDELAELVKMIAESAESGDVTEA